MELLIVDQITGEVINLKQLDIVAMNDEELAETLKLLESSFNDVREVYNSARQEFISRMEHNGAKLKLTSIGKFRINIDRQVVSTKLVEDLESICPQEFKSKCFTYDIRPLKTGLNELAKLGEDWNKKVNALYRETPRLKMEWYKNKKLNESESESESESKS